VVLVLFALMFRPAKEVAPGARPVEGRA